MAFFVGCWVLAGFVLLWRVVWVCFTGSIIFSVSDM